MSEVNQVFICSAPRSGSTFLDMLLGGHSQISSLGEVSFLGKVLTLDELCGCGEQVNRCEAWGAVLDRIARERNVDLRKTPYGLWQWDTRSVHVTDHAQQTAAYLFASRVRNVWLRFREYAPDGVRPLMPLPPSLSRGLENTLYLFDLIRDQWGTQLVVDSSKNLYKALSVYRERPESTKIILLTRDGRGVLYSRMKTGVPMRTSVAAWVKYYARAQALLERHVRPQDRLVVRYEEMATNTEYMLNSLCDFMGIAYEDGMQRLDSGFRHVVNGNQGTKNNSRLGIRLDEAWRDNLSATDLDYFWKVAGRLATDLGYKA
jgi:hypothetical protein